MNHFVKMLTLASVALLGACETINQAGDQEGPGINLSIDGRAAIRGREGSYTNVGACPVGMVRRAEWRYVPNFFIIPDAPPVRHTFSVLATDRSGVASLAVRFGARNSERPVVTEINPPAAQLADNYDGSGLRLAYGWKVELQHSTPLLTASAFSFVMDLPPPERGGGASSINVSAVDGYGQYHSHQEWVYVGTVGVFCEAV
jgi:hypothetical protein